MTPVVPPPSPCTTRDSTSNSSDSAKPNSRNAADDATSATSSTGRRPQRSLQRPHHGALTNCAMVNDETTRPVNAPSPSGMPNSDAPSPNFFT